MTLHDHRGPALILIRGGRSYEAVSARIDGGWLHAKDVRLVVGQGYRPVADKTWPAREIREIRWQEVAA